VHLCLGTKEEQKRLLDELVAAGSLVRLNPHGSCRPTVAARASLRSSKRLRKTAGSRLGKDKGEGGRRRASSCGALPQLRATWQQLELDNCAPPDPNASVSAKPSSLPVTACIARAFAHHPQRYRRRHARCAHLRCSRCLPAASPLRASS
jgi:hypothetical protein